MVTQVTASKQEAQSTDNPAAGELVDQAEDEREIVAVAGRDSMSKRPPAKQYSSAHATGCDT